MCIRDRYTDEDSDPQPMTYINGGTYSFEMPEADTELNAEYVKVTTELSMEPAQTRISVTQTRTCLLYTSRCV